MTAHQKLQVHAIRLEGACRSPDNRMLNTFAPVPPHQVKETPQETRYARRPRAEMCQSVCSDEYGNQFLVLASLTR
jgi:hypothetical protein